LAVIFSTDVHPFTDIVQHSIQFLPLVRGTIRCIRQKGLQVFDTFNKSNTSHGHYQIDGIEVGLAAKASGKVGLGICGGLKFIA
jgi:hypothetical protein